MLSTVLPRVQTDDWDSGKEQCATVWLARAMCPQIAWNFSGRFGDLDGKLFAEGTESGFQLVEPGSVPEI